MELKILVDDKEGDKKNKKCLALKVTDIKDMKSGEED